MYITIIKEWLIHLAYLVSNQRLIKNEYANRSAGAIKLNFNL